MNAPTRKATLGPVIAAALTPLGEDLAIDAGALAAHCRSILARGCDAIVLFGTSGEGASFTVGERLAALDHLLGEGVPRERTMLAVLASAPPDIRELVAAAAERRLAGALVMPPFFFPDVGADGLVEVYAPLAGHGIPIYLYNLPFITGFAVPQDVVARLTERFPKDFVGFKDSGGDFTYTEAMLQRFPSLAVFVGHENHVARAMALGGRGAISGIANLVPQLLRAVVDTDPSAQRRMERLVASVIEYPVVPALKSLMASLTQTPAWSRVRPPLAPLAADASPRLLRASGLAAAAATPA